MKNMETIILKTNMKCSGYIEKVTTALNVLAGKDHWHVDLQNPDKTLTVTGKDIEAKDIQSIVEKAGFKAERA
jgi:copper chaperone